MILTMLKGKIHRATVTQAELNYMGSITIDKTLMEASNIIENEKVQIVDINNGPIDSRPIAAQAIDTFHSFRLTDKIPPNIGKIESISPIIPHVTT